MVKSRTPRASWEWGKKMSHEVALYLLGFVVGWAGRSVISWYDNRQFVRIRKDLMEQWAAEVAEEDE